ncbi:ATP-dependent DNA helicase RecG [Dermatophilus congolensis]|nr:ATP-dependent DNA helicase RecG [Dermatophilus congolensis]
MSDWWSSLRGILPEKYAKALSQARGIDTAGDLLRFRPRKFVSRNGDLGDLHPDDYVVFVGVVTSASTRKAAPRRGRRPMTILSATVSTGPWEMGLTFFSAFPHVRELRVGRRGLFAGKVSTYKGRWQLAHPTYEFLPDSVGEDGGSGGAEQEFAGVSGVGSLLEREQVPVYRQVKGMPSWVVSRAVEQVLASVDLPDPLPESLRLSRGLRGYAQAWRGVHLPEGPEDFAACVRRLKYDEAFAMQVELGRRRAEQAASPAMARSVCAGGLLAAFDAQMPFALTQGQRRVGEEIEADLACSRPMNRLLQGDVGSGKTVVALRAMLAVVDAGGQAALLAPTEVLAQQHYRSISALLGPLGQGGLLGGAVEGTRVALLTGSDSAGQRRRSLLQVASGEAGIVVGTHALLQEGVVFADLGLVVVDEQHRFGVEQRDALRAKGTQVPHMLTMTATPIPRTVAMTVFGDMELSVLSELPGGRAAVQTAVVDNPRWYARAWERGAEEVRAGRQVYVVCPRIGDEVGAGGAVEEGFAAVWDGAGTPGGDVVDAGGGQRPSMRGVVEVFAELQGISALAGARMAVLHGRLPSDEKERVMRDFAEGRVDVLVATTVVEVGVDVPNATVMVIVDADRFGVSQLHQLRGRVGRGGLPGLCLLVTSEPTPGGRERLEAVAGTTDGFELSRLDLLSRREGDVLGKRQSGGGSQLQFLRLAGREDEEIIAMARQDAASALAQDAELTGFVDLDRILDDHVAAESVDFLQKG